MPTLRSGHQTDLLISSLAPRPLRKTRNGTITSAPLPQPLGEIQSPSTSFTLFPKLPAEIRLKIWKLAMPSRLLRFAPLVAEIPAGNSIFSTSQPRGQPRVLNQVNSEALHETKKEYKIVPLSSHHEMSFAFHPALDTIYLNRASCSIDIVHSAGEFPKTNILTALENCGAPARYLAVEETIVDELIFRFDDADLASWVKVEELNIIVGTSHCHSKAEVLHLNKSFMIPLKDLGLRGITQKKFTLFIRIKLFTSRLKQVAKAYNSGKMPVIKLVILSDIGYASMGMMDDSVRLPGVKY